MGGFSADWLSLREPVDHASINAELRRQLVAHLAARPSERSGPRIVDLGAGSGSNLRGLSPWLTAGQRWTLVDYDAGLLARAAANANGLSVETRLTDLATADLAPIVADADLVTASAFFDLASQALVDRVAAATAASGAAFYTVLSYDGVAAWLPGSPADAEMRRLFNAHQRTDKGLGRALGPDATDALEAAFRARGYTVLRGPSPWVVDRRNETLRIALDQGWADAVAETGVLASHLVAEWRETRARALDGAVTIVGHEDLLALPPG